MNSAPVQLLPVDVRGGNNDSTSKTEALPEKGRRFDDVFEKTTAESEHDKPKLQNTESREDNIPRKTESSKSKKETVADKSGNQPEKAASDDDEKTAVAGASAIKTEEMVEKLKKSLGDGMKADETLEDGKKSEIVVKAGKHAAKGLKLAHHSSLKGAEKSAAAELAGVIPGMLKGNRKPETGESETGIKQRLARLSEDGLAGKLKLAAEKAGVSEQKHNFSGKTGIELVSLADAKKSNPEKKAEGKDKKSELAGKFRIVDHRTVSVDSDKGMKTAEVKAQPVSGIEADTVAKFGGQASGGEQAAGSGTEGRSAEAKMFQSSVLNQLKDGINSQIVKQAGIIVKGDGTGEIKLVMKPESLGNVRIQLSLNDNHIAGRIIVENNIVREIFESNLENLYKAFGSEGFETGGLEVSVRGEGGENGANGRKNGRGRNLHAVKVMDEAVPELAGSEWRNNAVNMVV